MFPDYLDGAKVLEYTKRGNYAKTIDPWTDGIFPAQKTVCYAAICKYDNESSYYIFWCDGDYNVMQDWCWDSIEQCKRIHIETKGAVWHKK